MTLKCWKYFRCENHACPAFDAKDNCWLISGTQCRNEKQGRFLEKAEICLECQVFLDGIDAESIRETVAQMSQQFQSYKARVALRDEELEHIGVELAVGLSEAIEALRGIAAGDPSVRVSEESEINLLAMLKRMVNKTAADLGEIVDLTHEFAIGLAEHFDVMHRVTHGDRTARIKGSSKVELLEALKQVTNQTIESVYTEIAERKQAERSSRQSEALLRTVIDANPCCISLKDPEGRILLANKAIADLYAVTPEEMVGQTEEHLAARTGVNLEEVKQVKASEEEVTKSGRPRVIREWAFRRGDTPTRWFQLIRTPVVLADEKVSVLGVAVDVTERRTAAEEKRRLEFQLQQSQKMEALGTLAGGIAHDFNNILGVLVGYTELAKMRLAGGGQVSNELDMILQASRRATDLVKQILAFSRRGKQEYRPVHIAPILTESLKLLRASLPSTVAIKQDLAAKGSIVQSDPVQIQQVLMNLCTNAGHSMQDRGGTLTVSTSDATLDQTSAAVHPNLKPGPYLKLTVADTGHGIEPQLLDRIFDPFFTTKDRGVGTGMGLAVVHGIIDAHGGAVLVDSHPGSGSTFAVYLPRVTMELDPDLESERTTTGGTERVLFVDDEVELAQLAKEILTHLGYEAQAVTSSRTALELFREDPNAFDLVITDLTMPNLSGIDLAHELRRRRADLPIILCTGYSELITEESARLLGIARLCTKPLLADKLARVVRDVLDAKRETKPR